MMKILDLPKSSQTDVAGKFIGQSEAFRSILEVVRIAVPRKSTIMIYGETGTGKEMIAQQIRNLGGRKDRPFVPVDCTALSGQLFESQLFGHIKGAFTGAVNDSIGFYRAADTGTIFLDEIGELGLDLQAKLLRVLQESCVTPVGSAKTYPVDVRVICATNRDLKEMVSKGKFRADLYFRLNVLKIEVPPLRERKSDILLLAKHFIKIQADLYDEPLKELSQDAVEILQNYNWPGNVRELANVIERAYISTEGNIIKVKSFPEDILTNEFMPAAEDDMNLSFDELKKKHIILALHRTKGRKLAAAKLLNIDHRHLENMINKFGIQPTWK